jgi:uncharacterized protein
MFREAIKDLVKWKEKENRKPLIIRGARQVGKTWIIKEFGRTQYEKTAYINFDNNERMENLFAGNFDIQRLITGLQIEAQLLIEAGNTLIIFDEIQEVPRALTSLKYFCENAPQYHIAAAGSLLGVALHPGTSFPVGKVEFFDLFPLSFVEFLEATGNDNLVSLLKAKDFEMITAFKGLFIDLLKQYYYVGGMPESVKCLIETNSYEKVRDVQDRLLIAYEQDFSKHAPNEAVPRIRMLWSSIAAQLAKENRKFVYGLIRQGARAREYELAMQWLLDCGLIYKVCRVTKPDMPLMAYQDFNSFKLYVLDVGLLCAMSGLDIKSILDGNRVFEEFKGALTEQYVLQQIVAQRSLTPFYWTAEKSNGEIDFIFQYGMDIIPLEVKASENLQAKSLKNYCLKFKPRKALRASMSNYREEDWLTNIPLYSISLISVILE